MKYNQLGDTGLFVSEICLGAMTFGGQADKAESARMIDYCFDRGINFLDTANAYNKGASEEILGEILKGRRNRIILASKVRNVMGPAPDEAGLSRKAIFRAIEDSLRRLQTDYLDIYYLHAPDYAVPIEETLEAMDKLRTAGKIRSVASSNYSGWQVAQMFGISDKKGYQPPYLSQHMYNLMARGVEQEYLPMCKEFGISSIVYNPLAGGMLTGKQTREAPLAGTRFDKNQMYLDRFWHPDFFNAVDALKQIADAAGRSMISLSLNWLLHHTQTDCVILGASRLAQLEANLQAMEEGPLTADTLKACDEVWAKLRGVTPKYNR